MNRTLRLASTVIAALSLAMISMAVIAEKQAKADDGIIYCGTLVANTAAPSGVACSSSCWFVEACSAGFTLQVGAQCSCYYATTPPNPSDPLDPNP